MENLYKNIKKARIEKGIKVSSIARDLNITEPGYYKLESGRTQLTIERLNQISNILDIPIYILLALDEVKTNSSERVKDFKEVISHLCYLIEGFAGGSLKEMVELAIKNKSDFLKHPEQYYWEMVSNTEAYCYAMRVFIDTAWQMKNFDKIEKVNLVDLPFGKYNSHEKFHDEFVVPYLKNHKDFSKDGAKPTVQKQKKKVVKK